jgi:DnaJ-class molecular chaperone
MTKVDLQPRCTCDDFGDSPCPVHYPDLEECHKCFGAGFEYSTGDACSVCNGSGLIKKKEAETNDKA